MIAGDRNIRSSQLFAMAFFATWRLTVEKLRNEPVFFTRPIMTTSQTVAG